MLKEAHPQQIQGIVPLIFLLSVENGTITYVISIFKYTQEKIKSRNLLKGGKFIPASAIFKSSRTFSEK
jgi:hypothetical protein